MHALSSSAPSRPVYLRPRRYGSCMVAHAAQPAMPEPSVAVQSAASAQLNSHSPHRGGADVRAAALHDNTAALSFGSGAATVDTFHPVVVDAASRSHASVAQAPERSVQQTISEILALSLPALGSTLADPVCSLVDTALVGQVSSLQLAALSPCTAIFNLAFLVFQFVGVTITNKLACNSPAAAGISATEAARRQDENTRLVSYSLTFAMIAGLSTTALLVTCGPQILSAMGTNAAMMAPALSYLTWRAIAAPAVMIMNVCQGVCLGQQNSVTPLAVFASVGALNVVLDAWLILGQGMGCAGAAIATSIAQWLGALFFIHHLHKKGQRGESVPVRWMGLPTAKALKPFLGMASVLLSRTIFSMAAFTIITGAATTRGTLAAATHQVCLQLFWFLSYFPEPLSVAAQSLIARDRASRPRTLLLTRCILGLALALGGAIAAACASFFFLGAGLFTSDAAIVANMRTIAPAAFASLVLCATAMAVDGVSIGTDDYRHLPLVNLLGLGATAAWLHWCNVGGLGLQAVWLGMVVVFAVRLAVHLVHHLGTHAHSSAIAEALGWRQAKRAPQLALPACSATA